VAQDDLPTETMTPDSGRPHPAPRRRRLNNFAVSGISTVVLIVAFLVFAEIGAKAGWWSDRVLPAPSVILAELGRLLGQPQFWDDAARTGLEVAFSIVFGSLLGFAAGLVFWKVPAVGLNSMPPVYLKLARSLKASPRQTLFAIAIPAAGPFIVAGLRLAVVYALIGTIAMEFTTAQAGLGYRIRYLYEIFNNNEMFAYIAVVLVLSCILTVLLALVERVLLRGRYR
jgi:NitT/TauT family transport system permease protein